MDKENRDVEDFYNEVSKKMKFKWAKEFSTFYNKLHKKLINEYDNNVKSKDTNYKKDYLEQEIITIQKANINRLNFDSFVKEDTRKSSLHLDNVLQYFKSELANTYKNLDNTKKKKKEDFHWFKIGLSFAKGEPQILNKKGKSAMEITISLGFEGSVRPYFSETLGGRNTSDKNIYKDFLKMKYIYNYCIKNNIKVIENFENTYLNLALEQSKK